MNSSNIDKASKVLLLINSVISILGYIAFLQTEHQLVSPLIPSSTVLEISKHSIAASFSSSVLLIISLLFYFINKKILSIVISSLSLISYIILSNYIFL
jgi:hypothetical protein